MTSTGGAVVSLSTCDEGTSEGQQQAAGQAPERGEPQPQPIVKPQAVPPGVGPAVESLHVRAAPSDSLPPPTPQATGTPLSRRSGAADDLRIRAGSGSVGYHRRGGRSSTGGLYVSQELTPMHSARPSTSEDPVAEEDESGSQGNAGQLPRARDGHSKKRGTGERSISHDIPSGGLSHGKGGLA